MERSLEVSTKIVMILFCLEERGEVWAATVQGWKKRAGKEEVCLKDRPPRTDALAVYSGPWMATLGL